MPGTQITPAGGGGLNQINNAFGSIYGMFGGGGGTSGGPTGGGSGAYGLQPQNPYSGNDLTQMGRSLTNLLGSTGGYLGGLGTGFLGTGTGIAQGGLDVMGTGLNTLQPSIDYFTKILSGDPSTMTAAAAPAAANIASIFSGATDQVSRGAPAGGYRSAAQANLPYAQAGMVGNALLAEQPAAAQALGQLGGEQAQIGQGIAGVGTQFGQLGTTLAGLGLQGLTAGEQAVLQKMGLNLQEPSPFQDILGAVGAAGGILSGVGGIMHGSPSPCWIAEAIYGADDIRTHLIRAWINGPFKQTAFGRFVVSLYLRFGRAVAAEVRKRSWLKRAFRPLFDRALRSALAWVMA